MNLVERAGLAALRRLDPERAHGLALSALNAGLGPKGEPVTSARLTTDVGGIRLPNPVGLAAGFDKNAVAIEALAKTALGFIEVGAVTPRPQSGNPRPRLFRLAEDRAAINRFGFNNEGMETVAARLETRPQNMILGLNLGANKDSYDRAGDFAMVLRRCGPLVDFATVNVSSPNTERLRDLQGKDALSALLTSVMDTRAELEDAVPVFLKISPDLDDHALAEIAGVAGAQGIDAIIATNTTLDRTGLTSPFKKEAGGLSGSPLFARSTRVLARLASLTDIPLIGVGGISGAEDAYAKIRAGASAVQLYTGLTYNGLTLVNEILAGLEKLLARDGYKTVAAAVGTDRKSWA